MPMYRAETQLSGWNLEASRNLSGGICLCILNEGGRSGGISLALNVEFKDMLG